MKSSTLTHRLKRWRRRSSGAVSVRSYGRKPVRTVRSRRSAKRTDMLSRATTARLAARSIFRPPVSPGAKIFRLLWLSLTRVGWPRSSRNRNLSFRGHLLRSRRCMRWSSRSTWRRTPTRSPGRRGFAPNARSRPREISGGGCHM